jgi:hypothetical protein
MGEKPVLIVYTVGIVFSIAFFNATGVAITKYASASNRSTIDTCRTVLIWAVSLIMGTETFHGWLSVAQFFAFCLLVFATLIYNEIVVLPIKIFKENTELEI